MAQTILGKFDYTYPHIDAPTVEDQEYREREHRRRLIQEPYLKDDYTNPAFYYLRQLPWTGKRKLDGTNIRIYWDGEQAIVGGKTNNADLKSLVGFEDYIMSHFMEERFEEFLGRNKKFYLFGEWVGPKVQKNELGLDAPELALFDVRVADGVWLPPDAVQDIAEKFDVPTWQSFDSDLATVEFDNLDEAMYFIQSGRNDDWEGIVCEPTCQVLDRQGRRVICKIKNKEYNLGEQ